MLFCDHLQILIRDESHQKTVVEFY